MIYIGFAEYEPGQDPIGDACVKKARKYCPEGLAKYPYPHCFLMMGAPDVGYHRVDCFTNGISYVWYAPTGGISESEHFPPGLYFKFEDNQRELYAVYRLLDPWTRDKAHSDKRQMVKLLRQEPMVWPDIEKGAFTCTTFVLWLLGCLHLPHLTPQLIENLMENPYQEHFYGTNAGCNGLRWTT